ncbi:O-antigen ligase family protein [Methylomarinovum caldicuralii]|uniref:O-antigen ligase family protein n=1 Tax=Methylomarinovum caldicuralii TaxID=438856 RepID=UPI0029542EBC|nr:O-antigen ligase family protein [Methylomarinovum caldicuralii]
MKWKPPGSAESGIFFYLLTFALPLPIDLGLLGLAVCGSHAALSRAPRFSYPAWLGLPPFLLSAGLGCLLSPDQTRALHLMLALIPATMIYLLLAGYFERRHTSTLAWVLTALILDLGGWLLITAILHPGQSPPEWVIASGLTAFRVPNDIVLFAILLPFPLALLDGAGHRSRWLCWSALAVVLLLTVIYRSRLTLLVSTVTVGTFFLLAGKRWQLLRGLAFLAVSVLVLDGVLGFRLSGKFLSTWSSRLPLWLTAWRMFLDAPGLGHGTGSYLSLYRQYLDPADLPAWIVFDQRLTPWAHNLYLELLAELGLVGFLSFLGLVSLPLRNLLAFPEKSLFEYAFIAALAGFSIAALFELSLWRQWVGLTLLTIIGLMSSDQHCGQ